MKAIPRLLRHLLVALAAAAALTSFAQKPSVAPKAAHDFTGAFMVEHVTTVNPDWSFDVDVVGGGCVTGSGLAYCDNRGTQHIAGPTGTATYWLYTPLGSIALALTFEPDKGGGDPVNGIRFGGSFVVVPDSGRGIYRNMTGSGTWSGGAEFVAEPKPGANPPGPGRWAFWGTLQRAK